eukprot:TRINITY_DN6531_c0_g3_i1.p2 TRINITY_DN6531_c0_g3~~TRINITY_DN6531_c0_g3_i1.p2  ORF type:complete len:120 (-),score=1.30 TRINITY_DN6531_c0_g3_i1:153-512(-)
MSGQAGVLIFQLPFRAVQQCVQSLNFLLEVFMPPRQRLFLAFRLRLKPTLLVLQQVKSPLQIQYLRIQLTKLSFPAFEFEVFGFELIDDDVFLVRTGSDFVLLGVTGTVLGLSSFCKLL